MDKNHLPFSSADNKPIPVVTGLILIEGKFPLLLRHKGAESWWDLPGGKQDSPYETFAETIMRELEEELGVIACVHNEKPVAVTPHPYIKGGKKIYIDCGHVLGEAHNALPEEHDDLKLMNAEEAIALLAHRITPEVAQAMRDLEKKFLDTQARVKATKSLSHPAPR